MKYKSIIGTVSSLGQSEFDNSYHKYAYIEIIDASGIVNRVNDVTARNEVNPLLSIDSRYTLHFEKNGKGATLWAIETSDGRFGS